MSVMMTLLLVGSWLGAVSVSATPSAVELKPAAIALDSPPSEETQRSCVLYDRSGGMNVLSAATNDPAIGVDLREGSVPGLWELRLGRGFEISDLGFEDRGFRFEI